MYDVTIIGAGVIGGMTARRLSAYNLKICLLDKENDVAMGATKANSAIVHAGFDAKEGSLKAKFNVKGSEMMAQTAKELGVKYKNNGSIVIGFMMRTERLLRSFCSAVLITALRICVFWKRKNLKSSSRISPIMQYVHFMPRQVL